MGLVGVVPDGAHMRSPDQRELRLLRARPGKRDGQQASDQNEQQPLHKTPRFRPNWLTEKLKAIGLKNPCHFITIFLRRLQ